MLANRLADPVADSSRSSSGSSGSRVPFVTFVEKLDGDVQAEKLHAVYLRLYRRACAAANAGVRDSIGDDELLEGEAKISYNLALTKDVMVICPRVAEGGAVVDRDGKEVGTLSLNGTVLAGTALVKSEKEWDALRSDPGQLWKILGKIGVPSGPASTKI